MRWRFGGGGTHTLVFDGSGNWNVTNYLTVADGPATVITKSGTGTMTWTGANVPNSAGNSIIASPFTISNGIVVLKSGDLLGTQNIANNGNLLQYDTGNSTVTATTLSGVISGTGPLQVSSGTLTLSGANTYTGGTTISAGTLQVGAGGTSGSFGTGDVTNNGVLVFNRSDSVAFGNVISGAGSVVQYGSGTLTLAGANTYTGATTVSNGTLVVSLVGGDMDVSGGTLVPAAVGSVGTLNVAGSMNISAGTVVATLNRALSPSNSIFSVAGSLNNTAGTLKLLNFGPALAVGDKFTIFNQPVGGAAMTIVSPGFTAANNLAVDGSVTVSSVVPVGSGQITAAVSGGQLNLSWPAAYTGLHLQVQTNSLATGLGTNWVTIPGTDDANSYSNTMNTTNGSVFYRLAP
ncbi:MAG: autotransporter-associated beta strand repeat-containing protein [Verrucomicrobiota bacterium]